MTLIKELMDWIKNQKEDLRNRIRKSNNKKEINLFGEYLGSLTIFGDTLRKLAKKDRTFLEKSFTKNLNNSEIPKLYGDAIKFVINYKEDLEEVVRDG